MQKTTRITVAASALVTALAAAPATNTAPEIIVRATRIETAQNQVAASVEILSADALKGGHFNTALDALATLPGVDFSRSGGPGQQAALYLRGAKPQQTLVRIDGVRMNGQLDLSGYNSTHLQLFDIERIELLKGPQSPLYGSDAMAGVIDISTRRGSGDPAPWLEFEGGSYGTWRGAAGFAGSNDGIALRYGLMHYDRQGRSALKNNPEKDGASGTALSARLDLTPSDFSEITLSLRHLDTETDYDNDFGTNHADFKTDARELVTRLETTVFSINDRIETTAGIGWLALDRFEHGYDARYDASTLSADWSTTFRPHERHTLLTGIDGYRDAYDYDDGWGDLGTGHLVGTGLFATYQTRPLNGLLLNLGARTDEHEQFGGHTTWQTSAHYTLAATGTRLKSAFGTGFKAPSSYQLFSLYGSPSLQPEQSEGWELGLEQPFLDEALLLGATLFRTDYDELIDYDFATWRYANIARARSDGAECSARLDLGPRLQLRTAYTYLDNDDLSGGSFTLRRPQHQVDTALDCTLTDRLDLRLNANWIDERSDTGGVTLNDYLLVNLSAQWRLRDEITLFGRIENLLDEDYETVAGYNTDALSFYCGLRIGRR